MFKKARLKLTAWYLLIIMSVSITFSLVIAKSLVNEIDRFERLQRYRIESKLQNGDFILPNGVRIQPFPIHLLITNPELFEETKRRVFLNLSLINAGILIISGGLGYILAGRTLAPIQSMMDEQNRFVSDASHELRTPLTSLKTAFEVYLRSNRYSSSEVRTLITESVTEVNKLHSLSDSLLQLALYEKPNGQSPHEEISLSEIIKETIRRITPLARKKGIRIDFEEKNIIIKGSKYALIDLMVILLDNAVKYSNKNGKIEMKSITKNGFVLISIKDNGVGIAKKDISHIFDRFYRADTARSKEFANGYGLGLSIAKKIVSLHQGTIQVASSLRKGSVFTVRLPIFSKKSD